MRLSYLLLEDVAPNRNAHRLAKAAKERKHRNCSTKVLGIRCGLQLKLQGREQPMKWSAGSGM
jgi:hypothetical protein